MSVTDQLLENNEKYAAGFSGPLPLPPAKGVAVVACMDACLDVHDLLGLEEGDAHVIRNAGGVVTDDELRSLAISQRLLGTREIILIDHTDCGMLTFTDEEFTAALTEETGIEPAWEPRSFPTSTRTCATTSAGSPPTRTSPTPTRCAGSCSTSRPDGCARSPDRLSARARPRRPAARSTGSRATGARGRRTALLLVLHVHDDSP